MNKGIKEELLSLAYKYSLSARELKNLALEVAQQIEANSAAAHTSTQENSSKVEVGWYAFEGGKFSPDPIAYPNRQGVVAWLNPDLKAPIGKRGLIITPDEIQLPWADEYCKTGACDTEDGVLNTGKLMAHAKMYEA